MLMAQCFGTRALVACVFPDVFGLISSLLVGWDLFITPFYRDKIVVNIISYSTIETFRWLMFTHFKKHDASLAFLCLYDST